MDDSYREDENQTCNEQAMLNILYKEVKDCKKCDLGCEGQLDGHDVHVMGAGDPEKAEIMFVAEAPGLQETIHRRPLTPPGTSGKIYEKVLKALNLTRDDVWTTNTVLCRPEKNRDPELWEVHRCKQYLKRQLDIISPKLVVTFGRFAAQVFLGSFKITKEHGQLRRSESFGVDVFPLYHPAYIGAYAPQEKRAEFKQDVKLLKRMIQELKGE